MEKKLDLRIEKTYLALHLAFTSLLEEKLFENITVHELCEKAMIRRATFYKHFADKYEYFSFYLQEISRDFQSKLSFEHDYDLSTYFVHMTNHLFDFIEENDSLVRHIADSNLLHVLFNLLSEQIKNDLILVARKNGYYDHMDHSYLDNLISFYSGGLLNVILCSINSGRSLHHSSIHQIISDIVR